MAGAAGVGGIPWAALRDLQGTAAAPDWSEDILGGLGPVEDESRLGQGKSS